MELKSVVPWGRSFEEYKNIFSLTDQDLSKRILGCGDGPASFNAKLTTMGGSATSVDPTYQFTATELQSRIDEVYQEIMPQAEKNKDMYVWRHIPSVEALGKIRMSAMENFLSDYDQGKKEGRYIEASLPNLPFKDSEFELALCSHYLFLYSDQVSLNEHIESLLELCRVANEIRVYPLLALNGELSPHLNQVISELKKYGHTSELVNVAYEFQKGANQMLVVNTCNKARQNRPAGWTR